MTAFFVVCLHWGYAAVVSPVESYRGFTYRHPDEFGYTLAILLVLGLSVAMPRRLERVSDLLLWLLFMTVAAPSILLAQYADVVPPGQAAVLALHIAVCLMLVRLLSVARPRIGLVRLGAGLQPIFVPLCVLVLGCAISYLAYADLLSVAVLNPLDVYSIRGGLAQSFSTDVVVGYVLPIAFNVVGPMLLGLGLYLRRVTLVGVAVLVQYVGYASTGVKGTLFVVFALICLFYLVKGRVLKGYALFLATTLFLTFFVLIDYLRGSGTFSDLTFRRVLVVPGVLTSAYVKIFDGQSKFNFSQTLLPFIDVPYERSASMIVGRYFLGTEGVNASVSLWGDGYANYGFIGMYVASIILGVVLWVMDDAAEGLPIPLAFAIFLTPCLAVGESSIFTVMLTHGLVPAIFLAAIFPRSWLDSVAPTRPSDERRAAVDVPEVHGRGSD